MRLLGVYYFDTKPTAWALKTAALVACGFTAIDYPKASATISGITSLPIAYFVMYLYRSYDPDTMKRRKPT